MLQSCVNDGWLNRRFLELLEEVLTAIVCSDRSDYKIEVGSIKSELMMVLRLNFEVSTNILRDLRSAVAVRQRTRGILSSSEKRVNLR